MTGLADVVRHRRIIVPQLGAPGVSWPEVLRKSGFMVEYGPVRAHDLPDYLMSGTATPSMREVQFTLRDRIVLTPVELVHVALPATVAAVVLWFLAGLPAALAAVAAVLAGTVLFPILLPFIPTHDFSTKGFILGGVVALPFALMYGENAALPGMGEGCCGDHAPPDHPCRDGLPCSQLYRVDHVHIENWCDERRSSGMFPSWPSWQVPELFWASCFWQAALPG